jgi:hypothetical protein
MALSDIIDHLELCLKSSRFSYKLKLNKTDRLTSNVNVYKRDACITPPPSARHCATTLLRSPFS